MYTVMVGNSVTLIMFVNDDTQFSIMIGQGESRILFVGRIYKSPIACENESMSLGM